MTAVRLLPALGLALCVVFAFKAAGLISAPWPMIFDAQASAEPTVPAGDHAGDAPATAAAPEAKNDPVQLAANTAGPAEASSQGEADVLRSLSARRDALAARERDLTLREQTLAVAERRVEERVAELKAIEARINAALGQRDTAQNEQIQALVKMYESMKPGDAAKIFEKMNQDILIAVTSKMKPVKLGSVLALMDPGRAQDLTVLLANRLNADQISGAKPAPALPAEIPPPAPAAPAPVATAPAPVLQPDVLPQPKAELAPATAAPAPAAPASATLPADTLPAAVPPAPSSGVPAVAPVAPAAPGKT